MSRARRVDDNQAEIVHALRKAGVSVQHLHTIGQGCPDLLCGIMGKNFVLEVKDGNKRPSQRKLTEPEQKWHDSWRGQVAIVISPEDALFEVGLI